MVSQGRRRSSHAELVTSCFGRRARRAWDGAASRDPQGATYRDEIHPWRYRSGSDRCARPHALRGRCRHSHRSLDLGGACETTPTPRPSSGAGPRGGGGRRAVRDSGSGITVLASPSSIATSSSPRPKGCLEPSGEEISLIIRSDSGQVTQK
jgi:hypothetical protein